MFGGTVSGDALFTGTWSRLAFVAPALFRELNPAVQLAAAKATFARTGSLVGALSQMASDIVLGAAEHAQGFGIITAKYRITPKGLASEVTVKTADGYANTRTFYFKDLIDPPLERLALTTNYREVSKSQKSQQLDTHDDFMNDPSVHTVVLMSMGHQEGSDRNWMYIFQRDPKDPEIVRLIAVRLPDDPDEALALRNRVLIDAGLESAIPTDSPMDRIVLRGDSPTVTPRSLAAASPSGLFGITQDELKEADFGDIHDRQAAEIEALTHHMLAQLDAADLGSIDEQLEFAMQIAGRYLLSAAAAVRAVGDASGRDTPSAGAAAGGDATGLENSGASGEQLGAYGLVDEDAREVATLSIADAELSSLSDGISVADADGETSTLDIVTNENEEPDYYLNSEVEGGDDEYEPVQIGAEEAELEGFSLKREATEEEEDSEKDSKLNLELALTEAELAEEGKLTEEGEAERAILETLALEEERLRELIEELGGDASLFSTEPGEVSPLGLLIADGELTALSEIGEFNELLLAAEITDAVSSDYEEDTNDGDDAGDSGTDEASGSDGSALDAHAGGSDAEGANLGGADVNGAKADNESFLVADAALNNFGSTLELADGDAHREVTEERESNSTGEELAADHTEAKAERESDFWPTEDGELFAAGEQVEEAIAAGATSMRANRANRRRAAIRALNRMRHHAERLGINIIELIKLRQRRGLKRLWFEQLVFALAREMKFNFEQRQELARELELSSADFDDIRQAELAVRRELHARKMRTRLTDPLQNN